MNQKGIINIENRIVEYFESKKEAAKIKHEIDVIQENNNKLIELREQLYIVGETLETIDSKIIENNNKIFNKFLVLSELSEKNAPLAFIFEQLNNEDRKILELRYRKKYSFTYMTGDLHRSKSSLSRRNTKILSIIEHELDYKCNGESSFLN